MLLRFLQNLSSVTSDVFVQELVNKVLCCCQDVVKPFLSSLSATYEPRLSMPWIANMNLVTKVRKLYISTGILISSAGDEGDLRVINGAVYVSSEGFSVILRSSITIIII